MAIHTLESVVANGSTVEVWSKSYINSQKIEDTVPLANDPEKRRVAANRLSGALRSDTVAPQMRYEPVTQSLKLGDKTIGIVDYAEQQSLLDKNRGEISKRLYHHYHLGNGLPNEEMNPTDREKIKRAYLKTFDIKDVKERNRYVVFLYLDDFLKSHDGSCVISALPKPEPRFRLPGVSDKVRLANQEKNRIITGVLRQGATRNIGSLASSTVRSPSVSTVVDIPKDSSDSFAMPSISEALDPIQRTQDWVNRAPESMDDVASVITAVPPRVRRFREGAMRPPANPSVTTESVHDEEGLRPGPSDRARGKMPARVADIPEVEIPPRSSFESIVTAKPFQPQETRQSSAAEDAAARQQREVENEQVAKELFRRGNEHFTRVRRSEGIEVYNELIERFGDAEGPAVRKIVDDARRNKAILQDQLERLEERQRATPIQSTVPTPAEIERIGRGIGRKYKVSDARDESPGFKLAFRKRVRVTRGGDYDHFKKPGADDSIWNRWVDLNPITDVSGDSDGERFQRTDRAPRRFGQKYGVREARSASPSFRDAFPSLPNRGLFPLSATGPRPNTPYGVRADQYPHIEVFNLPPESHPIWKKWSLLTDGYGDTGIVGSWDKDIFQRVDYNTSGG